jgi:hypothetical protein
MDNPQVVGAPQQMMMTTPGGDIFQGADTLFIQQEMAVIELCSIEAKQRYKISKATADKKEGTPFLYVTEESQCLERLCCGANRKLMLKVHGGPTNEHPVIQTMRKPFHLQSCCCFRPSFEVSGADGNTLGVIKDPCRCCAMDQQVFNASEKQIFTVSGMPCQIGTCCPCCAGIGFNVQKDGATIGNVTKMPVDCAELFLKTNRFIVDFGSVREATERQLLLSAAMLLDLQYFEQ